jgi:hypothetical protein
VGLIQVSLRPFRAEPVYWTVPGVETPGFYEAEFVKTRRENVFFLFLANFDRHRGRTHLFGFGA